MFYVLEGTMSLLVGDEWIDAPQGSFVLVPGGMTHDFENRGDVRAGVLNFSAPGDFEPHMPGIAEWFARASARGRREMSAEQRMRELGIALPAGSAPAANYANAVRTGNLLFIAGKAPLPENGKLPKGRLGRELASRTAIAPPAPPPST